MAELSKSLQINDDTIHEDESLKVMMIRKGLQLSSSYNWGFYHRHALKGGAANAASVDSLKVRH